MTTQSNEEKLNKWRKKILNRDFDLYDQPTEAMAEFWLSHLTAERTALIEEMKSKKVIMWSDDSAQYIRNIQHNETIEQMISLVSHLESGNEKNK